MEEGSVLVYVWSEFSDAFAFPVGEVRDHLSAEGNKSCDAFQTENFLHKVYEGNAKGLVSALIQKDLLTAADYEDLKKYWDGLNNEIAHDTKDES